MLPASKNPTLEVKSEIGKQFHELIHVWLLNVDEIIGQNINQLTCNNLREMYFSLFCELKKWRSNSGNFTGFGELLIFRAMIRALEEEFTPISTGDLKDPIRFKSSSYEIGQSIVQRFYGKKMSPDVYINHNNKLIGIVQIKIKCEKIEKEIDILKFLKEKDPNIKGLLVAFVKLSQPKEDKLTKAGYETLNLHDNDELILKRLKDWLFY
jgi:hypothetical protein